jgi:hypothetical protein
VDQRNFPYVDGEGYPDNIDKQIWQSCKYVSNLRYGTLPGSGLGLMNIGNGGTSYLDRTQDDRLSFRINDNDQCLGDNAGAITVTVTLGSGAR